LRICDSVARDTLGFFGLFGARIQVRTTNGASLRNRAEGRVASAATGVLG
jgi:hypothetical protein